MSTAAHEPGENLLTVVISVYNLEHYVRDCLESVLQQRYIDEIEVIVVDDGSTDSSRAQIEATLSEHPGHRVTVISQPNAGLSAARNLGIARARSRYLAFIDGDDMWSADFSDQVMPILQAGQADLIEFNIGIVTDAGLPIDARSLVPDGCAGPRPVDAAALLEFVETYEAFVWARVYRSTLWDGIRFPVGRYYEDNATVPQLYLKAHTSYRLEGQLYRYRRRGGSITNVATLGTVRDLALNAEEALARCTDGAHREYWLRFFYKSFMHACSQNVRVDAASFSSALQVMRSLAQQHRAFLARDSSATPRRSLDGFVWRVHLARGVFFAKRAIKRMLGREIKPRPRLAMTPPAGMRTAPPDS
jgi:glycosyltransferase involved in cell wall biosynthesis